MSSSRSSVVRIAGFLFVVSAVISALFIFFFMITKDGERVEQYIEEEMEENKTGKMVKMCLFYNSPSGHARTDPILSQTCPSDHVHTVRMTKRISKQYNT